MNVQEGNAAIRRREPREGEYAVSCFSHRDTDTVIVRPDEDGLGLVEVDGGGDFGRLVVTRDMVGPLIAALRRVAASIDNPVSVAPHA